MDSLVSAGEDLAKFDPQVEATVNRVINTLKGLLDDGEDICNSLNINERSE